MKILNLYAGIGGNRKLWEGHEVTAVELDESIANVYKILFPEDEVLIEDAHDYLLKNHTKFDLIWSSPPCQSHSVTNHFLKGQGIYRYPDMKLWQEIIFLKHFFKGKWVVENVKSYYKPVIEPTAKIGRHYFWSNFDIIDKEIKYTQIGTMNRSASKEAQKKAIVGEVEIPGFINLDELKKIGPGIKNKRQVLRNCVYPELGKHILNILETKPF